MKARGLLVFVCAMTALVALPLCASAKPGYFTAPRLHYAKIVLRGSNGYHLLIHGFPGNVDVSAEKGNAEVGYYSSSGTFRHDRVRAKLPGVGIVDLRFHEQSRSREETADDCTGPGELTRSGFFKGRVRIEGERDYTRVDVRSARGKIFDDPKQTCHRDGRARHSAAAQEELVEAAGRRGRGFLSFSANEWPPFAGSHPVFFHAHLARLRGEMLITNSVDAFTEDPKDLVVSRPPLAASVEPPKPFTGTAGFQRESDETFTWLGDLAVELPGIGPVALAGPGFEAKACTGRTCKGSDFSELLS
jgi:hypothetical protein